MTGHLGYESTGLNALRGQNNVQGLNDSGANPAYLHGYQSVEDPEVRKKFTEAWGVEVPETPGYRLDQIMAACHDNRIQALYLIGENPMQTEPNAHHVEEGIAGLEFIVSQDIFLNDMTMKYADVVLPASSFAEKDGTFTNTERRVNRVRAGVPCPGKARVDREIVIDLARALGANGPTTRTPSRSGTRWPTSRRRGTASATTGSRSRACSGLRRSSATPARRTSTRRGRLVRADARSSSPSSTSRRSSSPTPSIRSSSTPAARSITTTRRR